MYCVMCAYECYVSCESVGKRSCGVQHPHVKLFVKYFCTICAFLPSLFTGIWNCAMNWILFCWIILLVDTKPHGSYECTNMYYIYSNATSSANIIYDFSADTIASSADDLSTHFLFLIVFFIFFYFHFLFGSFWKKTSISWGPSHLRWSQGSTHFA